MKDFVGVVLNPEVGDGVLLDVIAEVGLLLEGGVPVGNAVAVTERVAGLVGVLVNDLCGERDTFGVFVVVGDPVDEGVGETDEVPEDEGVGVIDGVCEGEGDGVT